MSIDPMGMDLSALQKKSFPADIKGKQSSKLKKGINISTEVKFDRLRDDNLLRFDFSMQTTEKAIVNNVRNLGWVASQQGLNVMREHMSIRHNRTGKLGKSLKATSQQGIYRAGGAGGGGSRTWSVTIGGPEVNKHGFNYAAAALIGSGIYGPTKKPIYPNTKAKALKYSYMGKVGFNASGDPKKGSGFAYSLGQAGALYNKDPEYEGLHDLSAAGRKYIKDSVKSASFRGGKKVYNTDNFYEKGKEEAISIIENNISRVVRENITTRFAK
jgi:hypothetical protein